MTKRTRLIVALSLNAAIVLMEVIGLALSINSSGLAMFQYYTQDSNYFALIASTLFVATAATSLKEGTAIPSWVKRLRYMATCCLTLTFLVVLFVLIPMMGFNTAYYMLFSGSMLYHHFLCPVIAIVSLVFFEESIPLTRKNLLIAMIPTAFYAVVIIILNVAHVLVGPYPFLHVYEQPVYMSIIWTIVILGMALLIAWLLALSTKAASRKRNA